MRTIRRLALLSACLVGLAGSAKASDTPDLTLIVSRGPKAVEFFLSFPAELIVPLLGADPAEVFSDDGRVPIDKFRIDGSFDLANDIFTRVRPGGADRALAYDALSMMLHPDEDPLPFTTPWEAYGTISVCTVDYESDALRPEGLSVYYGGYAPGLGAREPFTLSFPETGRGELDVVIRHFDGADLLETTRARLSDGGTLSVAAPGLWHRLGVSPAQVATVLLALAAVWALVSWSLTRRQSR